VNIRAHCPQLTAVDAFSYDTLLPFAYRVRVSNDQSGFVRYLAKTNVACSVMGTTYNGTVNEDEDTIECAAVDSDRLGFDKQRRRLAVYRYGVEFDGVPLRVDDGADNYFTVYNAQYCDGVARKTEGCVACFWHHRTSMMTSYYKRCSARNQCTGLFEYYDRTSGGERNDDDDSAAAEPPAGACPEMTVRSVEPLTAPWSGGTTLVISVGNHELLAESRKVTVTVAGRDCVYPQTVNGQTITCTVGPPKPEDSPSGPVRVAYGPLRLTSAHEFRFLYPKPTALSPACGPVSGGTLLRIAGRSMDAGSTVTVSVGPADVPCEVLTRSEDHVLCATGPSADGRPVAGDVTVVFDKLLRRTVQSGRFAYAGDPTLSAQQPFAGIASGGTYLPVRGRHLSCVANATLYVDDPEGVRHYADCAVRNNTFMACRSPALDAVPRSSSSSSNASSSAAVLLNFGFRVRFAGHTVDLSPQPDFPGYRMYADPVFADFQTDGRNVIINGRRLDRGFRSNVDLTIRLRNAKGALCTVVDVQRRQIVCVQPSSDDRDDDLRELYVTVGLEFARTVKRKKNNKNDDNDRSSGAFGAFLLLIVGVLIGACFVSSLVGLIYVVWYKKCDIRRYV